MTAGHYLPPRQADGIPGRIHRNDLMFGDGSERGAELYATTGRAAVDLIGEALTVAGRDFSSVGQVLDLGCGHGRVLRWLVQRVPPSAVTACDIDPEAVAFCASEFKVKPLLGAADFESVVFGTYDVVWAGSLATHLPEDRWLQWVQLLPRLLNPGGTVAFTTHEPALVHNPEYAPDLARHAVTMAEALSSTGFAYLPYGHYASDTYGVAFHDPERVRRDLAAAGLTRTVFLPRGWVGHQDVHAFQKPD